MCTCLSLALLIVAAFEQRPLPTQADLDATIEKWNEAARPGRIMRTKSSTPAFLLTDDAFAAIEDAEKIGDKEIVIELAKTGKAFLETSSVRVRVLGSVDYLCPAFRTLHMECKSGADKLRGSYKELVDWHTRAGRERMLESVKRVGVGTERELDRRMTDRAKAFREHDISLLWSSYYANVRVLDGKRVGDRGFIRFAELKAQ